MLLNGFLLLPCNLFLWSAYLLLPRPAPAHVSALIPCFNPAWFWPHLHLPADLANTWLQPFSANFLVWPRPASRPQLRLLPFFLSLPSDHNYAFCLPYCLPPQLLIMVGLRPHFYYVMGFTTITPPAALLLVHPLISLHVHLTVKPTSLCPFFHLFSITGVFGWDV